MSLNAETEHNHIHPRPASFPVVPNPNLWLTSKVSSGLKISKQAVGVCSWMREKSFWPRVKKFSCVLWQSRVKYISRLDIVSLLLAYLVGFLNTWHRINRMVQNINSLRSEQDMLSICSGWTKGVSESGDDASGKGWENVEKNWL